MQKCRYKIRTGLTTIFGVLHLLGACWSWEEPTGVIVISVRPYKHQTQTVLSMTAIK